jgi:hypothetical protein
MNRQRHGLSTTASQDLVATIGRIDCRVEKLAIDFASTQTPLLQEMAQRFLNFGMQDIGKLMGVVAVGGAPDEGFHGGQQGSIAREPNRLVRPVLWLGVLSRRLYQALAGGTLFLHNVGSGDWT